jgi:fumarylacetoacetate (FAA) hydrolase family protein
MNPKQEPTIQEIAAEEVEAMKAAKAPKGIAEADIAAKVAVGLTRNQAIEVLERQAAEDAAAAKDAKGSKAK